MITYPRFSLLALILLCFFCGLLRAEDLPSDAAKLVASYTADVSKARTSLIAGLNKTLGKYTKSGNLEAANAIKAKVDALTKEESDASLLGDQKAPKQITVPASFADKAAKITLPEWESITADEIVFDATLARVDTGIELAAGESVVIVPRPGDTWAIGPLSGYPKVRYDSEQLHLLWATNGEPKACIGKGSLLATGPGKLILSHNDPGNPSDNWGSLHIKIVKVSK